MHVQTGTHRYVADGMEVVEPQFQLVVVRDGKYTLRVKVGERKEELADGSIVTRGVYEVKECLVGRALTSPEVPLVQAVEQELTKDAGWRKCPGCGR